MTTAHATYSNRFETALAHVLNHEGGWSDHPNDPGGATMMGVTKRVWESWVGHAVTKNQLAALTANDIKPLYWTRYYAPVRGDDLPVGVHAQVFDLAVNAGVRRAGIVLQDAIRRTSRIHLVKDGVIGPKTLTAAEACDPLALIAEISFRRLTFYSQLRHFKTFANGWRRRTLENTVFATEHAVRAAEDLAPKDQT